MTHEQAVPSTHAIQYDTITSVERTGTITVLRLNGAIDLTVKPDIEHSLHRALESTPSMLVIDLSGVTFMSSTGLAMLLEARARTTQTNIDLRLVTQQRVVLRVLEITGTTSLFRTHASIEHATEPTQVYHSAG